MTALNLLAAVTIAERRWLREHICGFCEIRLTATRCGNYSGPHILPIIEGVRDKEEAVDLGPPCDMNAKRESVISAYRQRKAARLAKAIA